MKHIIITIILISGFLMPVTSQANYFLVKRCGVLKHHIFPIWI